MATRFHLGAKTLRGAFSAYAKRFGLLEIPLGQPSTPSLATLRRYRREAPPSFEFAVVLPPALSTPRPGAALDAALAQTREAIDTLGARMLVLRTTMDVTPSALWRRRVEALLAQLPRDASAVAWEPSGLWEPSDVARQAQAWGVVPVIDGVQNLAVPPGPLAYVRLRALGETRSFGPALIEQLADVLLDRRDAYVVFESDKALESAKELRRAVARGRQGLGAEAHARVMRPRALVRPRGVASADEQE